MVDLGHDNPDDPSGFGFDAPEGELLSRTYLRLMEGRPTPGSWRYALETVPGTLEVVMLDLPDAMVVFTDEQVQRRGHERLREAGLRNLARERPDAQVVDGGVYYLTGSDYTASTALVLPELVAGVSGETELPDGVLVSMPERSVLLYHVVRDESVLAAMNTLIGITLGEFDEGHKPISRHVYWWHRGRFTPITGFEEDGTVNVHIDGEFEAVFNRVCAVPAGEG